MHYKATVKETFEGLDDAGKVIGTFATFEVPLVVDGRVASREFTVPWPSERLPSEGQGARLRLDENGFVVGIALEKPRGEPVLAPFVLVVGEAK